MTTARKAPVSGAELIAEARRLAPLLAEHAPEGERLRRAPDAVIRALREARIFDLMVPEVHGGLGLDADTFLEVGLALAEGDAAMAWLTFFYIEHNWMFCQFPMSFQEKLYASTSHVLAPAVVAPTGKSVEVDGGFRVSGRWQFGTGIEHADDWVILMTLVPSDSGPVQLRMCALRRDQVTVEDDWFTDGMRATGSNTIVVEDAVIPAEQAILVQPISDGTGAVHDLPLYRTPMQPLIMLAVSMPAVGQARAAVRGFAERARNRSFLGSKTKLAETPAAQMRLARAELEANQAEQLLRSMTTELMALRNNATVADRARMTAMTALAVDQSKRVLRLVHDASGASAHRTSDPLQRGIRDVQALSAHPTLSMDTRLETMGRTMFGFEPGVPV
ncbi:hypothetical protein [Amycolatopsis pithecellobii]|uniref:Acyl-CoA dehydrogenase C-terminal domain-containing protein n=1 Tax=Amycolatopsis pithecellobii TaxID=664692 RepID=A0A6N7ZCI9_9PSEU|nr:hypothetical protein [Amycolatopsis pithecellobii]MTD59448.1 hypothetical protein [Amycolatopsis pithecellobii]